MCSSTIGETKLVHRQSEGQPDRERAADTLAALDRQAPAVLLDDLSGASQTDARAADAASYVCSTVEALEDRREVGLRDAETTIFDRQDRPLAGSIPLPTEVQPDVAAQWAVLPRIAQQITQHPFQPPRVPAADQVNGRRGDLNPVLLELIPLLTNHASR